MKPNFSIIIPTYNRADLLLETIRSVQNQTFGDWECIVVDDGSTDNTRLVVEEIIRSDSRLKYIYQQNTERSAARNNGYFHSIGEWICFLDSDDLFDSNHLELLNLEIKSRNIQAFFFTGSSTLCDSKIEINRHETYVKQPDYFINNSVIPARVCIHRNLLNSFNFDPEIVIVEDTVLWTYLHFNYPTIQLDLSTIIYRWHDENSVNISKNCFLPRLRGLKKMFGDKKIRTKIPRISRNQAISNCYYGIAKYHEFKKNFTKMIWWAFLSILSDPRSPQTKAKIYMLYAFYR
jgi:glycosyltransferase involved in cell wall biosynthesis